MKRLLVILALAASMVPVLADARDRGYSYRDRGYAPSLQGGQGQYSKRGEGDFQRGGGRDFRREEARPRDERPPPGRPPGRMTEEERRQLQRDLDRANREIYRRGPPR